MREECGELIIDEEWGEEDGDWTKHQYVPQGHELIGLKWYTVPSTTNSKPTPIYKIGFLTWKP